jgi:hypothetical protein
MNWLIGGSEVVSGIALLVATGAAIGFLRPRNSLQERLIVRFPGAWIVVGLSMTILIATSVALIAIGASDLR